MRGVVDFDEANKDCQNSNMRIALSVKVKIDCAPLFITYSPFK